MSSAPGFDNTVARLGAVSFLNTRPLVDGLDEDPHVELQYAVPSALPALLAEGQVDAALVPVIDLARNLGKWERVSDSCIASDGRTLTVRVFSKLPPEQMEVLHVDPDSHTSVALARLIWMHVYRRPLRIEPMPAVESLRDCSSVLLIGDKVATTPMPWFDHHLDLGDAWKKWTGFPFVFAVWVARCGTGIQPVKPKCGTGIQPVKPKCGTGFQPVKPKCGTGFQPVESGCGGGVSPVESGVSPGDSALAGKPPVARGARCNSAEVARALEAARDRGVARAAQIAVEYGPKRGWPRALAVEYLTQTLMFKLTPAALAGMNRYCELLAEAGLVPRDNQDVVTTSK